VVDAHLKENVKAERKKATVHSKGSVRAEKYLLHYAQNVANRLTPYISKNTTFTLGTATILKVITISTTIVQALSYVLTVGRR